MPRGVNLTQDQINEIFDRYNDGEFNGVLARKFGVCRNHLQKVVKREKFRRDRKQ